MESCRASPSLWMRTVGRNRCCRPRPFGTGLRKNSNSQEASCQLDRTCPANLLRRRTTCRAASRAHETGARLPPAWSQDQRDFRACPIAKGVGLRIGSAFGRFCIGTRIEGHHARCPASSWVLVAIGMFFSSADLLILWQFNTRAESALRRQGIQ